MFSSCSIEEARSARSVVAATAERERRGDGTITHSSSDDRLTHSSSCISLGTSDGMTHSSGVSSATESGGPLAWFLRRVNPLYVSVPSSAATNLVAEDAGVYDFEAQKEGWINFSLAVGDG